MMPTDETVSLIRQGKHANKREKYIVYQTPINSMSTCKLIRFDLNGTGERKRSKHTQNFFKVSAKLIAIMASRHVDIECKIDLLNTFLW